MGKIMDDYDFGRNCVPEKHLVATMDWIRTLETETTWRKLMFDRAKVANDLLDASLSSDVPSVKSKLFDAHCEAVKRCYEIVGRWFVENARKVVND